MTEQVSNPAGLANELTLTRLIDASADKLYRAWTEPELIMQWFAPRPWTVSAAQIDLRPGGSSLITMRSPEGEEFPNHGVYLEVVENRRLVFTDAYQQAWVPSEKPFMTGIINFEPEAGKTRYSVLVRHWNAEDCKQHEEMGFHQGWGQCADQLTELVLRL